MPVETHRRPRCLRSPIKILTHTRHIYIYLNILINTYFLLIYIHIHGNNVRALNRHVGLWWVFNVSPIRHICWSLIRHVDHRPSMSVTDGFSIKHVGLRWGMSVSDGSTMKHVGLRWGMPVSDGSSICLRWVFDQACMSPTGLRYVSNGTSIRHTVSDGSLIILLFE